MSAKKRFHSSRRCECVRLPLLLIECDANNTSSVHSEVVAEVLGPQRDFPCRSGSRCIAAQLSSARESKCRRRASSERTSVTTRLCMVRPLLVAPLAALLLLHSAAAAAAGARAGPAKGISLAWAWM